MPTFVTPRPARFVRCLTALVSLALITACSGESEPAKSTDDKRVASVTEPSGNPSQAPVQVERPLIRPDTTAAEEWRLQQVYLDCQAQQDLAKYMIKNEDGSWKGYKGGNDRLWEAAKKACASKEPETMAARTAREDPKWKDKYLQWLKCMRSHGLKVEPTWDTPGFFAFTDGLPPVSQEKWIKKCEAEVYVVD